ncbi:MAG: DUF2924 domain-containing protein [Bdellovibrionales bacterium]|jgi:hypothetical protein
MVVNNEVLIKITALKTMPIGQLKKLWKELYRADAPEFNRNYLVSRLAYRIQELAWGGDVDILEKRMAARAKSLLSDDLKQRRKAKIHRPPVGTRLLRDYQGVEYRVTVLADGFAFNGRKYRSLSRIAQIITGTPWSGPAFFGLARSSDVERKEKA